MEDRKQDLIAHFKKQGGIMRFSAMLKAGFHSDSISSLEKEKKIIKFSRGVYRLSDYDMGSHPDLIMVSLQAPKGIICLISALAFHEATNEIPGHVEVAIRSGTHANRIKYPPVRFYRFSQKTWEAGIEEHRIKGHKVRVYGLAKTIADCFKFRNKIGINVAREAMKTAIAEKGIKPKELMRYAAICRVDSIIKPILEAML